MFPLNKNVQDPTLDFESEKQALKEQAHILKWLASESIYMQRIGGLLYFHGVLSLSFHLKEQAHSYSIYLQRLEGCCILTAYALYPAI